MSGIKPPGGPEAGGAPAGPEATETDDVGAAGEAGAVADVSGGVGDAVAELSSRVQAGELTMDEAVRLLVDRAVAGVADRLSETERGELSDVLERALADDPTFAALRRGAD